MERDVTLLDLHRLDLHRPTVRRCQRRVDQRQVQRNRQELPNTGTEQMDAALVSPPGG